MDKRSRDGRRKRKRRRKRRRVEGAGAGVIANHYNNTTHCRGIVAVLLPHAPTRACHSITAVIALTSTMKTRADHHQTFQSAVV